MASFSSCAVPLTVLLCLHLLLGFPSWVYAGPCDIETYEVYCKAIRTAEFVASAMQDLQRLRGSMKTWRFRIMHTNVDLLPDDFFASINVNWLDFEDCSMEEVPSRLIKHIGDSLQTLTMHKCSVASKTLPTGGFKYCKKCDSIRISQSDIQFVSPRAFEGPLALTTLEIRRNKVQRLDKEAFHGLSDLYTLYLDYNKLEILDEGVFDPLVDSVKWLWLKDNPFHCNCSLKWLQDWIIERKAQGVNAVGDVTCATPQLGSLATMEFCTNYTMPTRPITTTTGQPTGPDTLSTEMLSANESCIVLKRRFAALLKLNCFSEQHKVFCYLLANLTNKDLETKKGCEEHLEKELVLRALNRNCFPSDEAHQLTSTSVPTCANFERQYRCHMDKMLAQLHDVTESSQFELLLEDFCQHTTTPLTSASTTETKYPRNNLLSSAFCADVLMARQLCHNYMSLGRDN